MGAHVPQLALQQNVPLPQTLLPQVVGGKIKGILQVP
jgi:hypothetical protein